MNKPVLKQFSSLGVLILNDCTLLPYLENFYCNLKFSCYVVGGAQEAFVKPALDEININHLHAIINHQGLGHRITFTHPRSVHIFLGYPLLYRSFSIRTIIVTWIGPKTKDNEKYRLFEKA